MYFCQLNRKYIHNRLIYQSTITTSERVEPMRKKIVDLEAGGGITTDALLSNTYKVAVAAVGNILIMDRDNSRIRKIEATTGIITTIANIDSNFCLIMK